MKEYKETTAHEIIAVTCDVCGKKFDDIMELQEFLFVNFTGGYSSVFGDMIHVECDICQRCLKEIAGKYCRFEDRW